MQPKEFTLTQLAKKKRQEKTKQTPWQKTSTTHFHERACIINPAPDSALQKSMNGVSMAGLGEAKGLMTFTPLPNRNVKTPLRTKTPKSAIKKDGVTTMKKAMFEQEKTPERKLCKRIDFDEIPL